jgi:FkbM family methyltransferase
MLKPRHVIVRSDYGPIVINRHDNTIGRAISECGSWEKDEIELLRWVVSACYRSDTEIEILDVGANVGSHTLAFAKFPFSRVTVHAFEAQLEIFEMLVTTVELNHFDNVRCHHNAASSISGELIRIPAVDYEQAANFGALELESAIHHDFDGKRVAGTTETIETIRIDDMALDRVRLMKIDTEGMEHKVLAGAAQTIGRCRPVLFLEYEKTDFSFVKCFLRDGGYRSYYAQRPNILCVPAEFGDIRFDGAVSVKY